MMEHEFGSGLRAHLGRHLAGPARADHADPTAEVPAVQTVEALPTRRETPQTSARPTSPSIDERIERISAAEAELSFRERRAGERETSVNVAVQRGVYQLAQDLFEGGAPALPQDELAVARARRGGRAA